MLRSALQHRTLSKTFIKLYLKNSLNSLRERLNETLLSYDTVKRSLRFGRHYSAVLCQ
jgi:hypothetical protein